MIFRHNSAQNNVYQSLKTLQFKSTKHKDLYSKWIQFWTLTLPRVLYYEVACKSISLIKPVVYPAEFHLEGMHRFPYPLWEGAVKQNLIEILRKEKDKATVAPGPPSFTSFPNPAPLRRWRKLLAVGVITLDLGKGVAKHWEFLP